MIILFKYDHAHFIYNFICVIIDNLMMILYEIHLGILKIMMWRYQRGCEVCAVFMSLDYLTFYMLVITVCYTYIYYCYYMLIFKNYDSLIYIYFYIQ